MGTALIIDDSRAIRMMLGRMLDRLGFEAALAASSREAVAILNEQGLDLAVILVDWAIPEMNLPEFASSIRIDPRFGQVPLLIMTTEFEIEQMGKAREAGANDYVGKPVTAEAIAGKLRLLGVLR